MTSSLEDIVDFPVWLDAMRQPDAMQAAAYESCSADFRASLKTAIAFGFHLWRESAAITETRLVNPRTGFSHMFASRPAAWTLALLSPGYASPARFLAAILPSILAGVDKIAVAALNAPPSSPLCTAFELAGLEDIFILTSGEHDASDLLHELHETDADGRILFFPMPSSSPSPCFSAIRQTAESLKLPLWSDSPAPRLYIACSDGNKNSGDVPRRDIIAWAHGDAEFLDHADSSAAAWFTPYSAGTFHRSEDVPAVRSFGPGMEACWIHPLLDPDYFRTRALCAYLNR